MATIRSLEKVSELFENEHNVCRVCLQKRPHNFPANGCYPTRYIATALERAPSTLKRALHILKKALYTLKRSLYTLKRALYTLKRDLCTPK